MTPRPSVAQLLANLEVQLSLYLVAASPEATEILIDRQHLARWLELVTIARQLSVDLIPERSAWSMLGGFSIGVMVGLASGMAWCWY